MSSKAGWRAYWRDVEPKLGAFAAAQRSPELHAALGDALGFFGFVTEGLERKATRHAQEQMKVAPLLTEALDLLRGIRSGYEAQLLASLTLCARTAFEIRCGVEYLGLSSDVPKLADMFVRLRRADEALARASHVDQERHRAFDRGGTGGAAETGSEGRGGRTQPGPRVVRRRWQASRGPLDRTRSIDLRRGTRRRSRKRLPVPVLLDLQVHARLTARALAICHRRRHGAARDSRSLFADGFAGLTHCLSLLRAWCELFAITWPAEEYPGIRERIQKAATMIEANSK